MMWSLCDHQPFWLKQPGWAYLLAKPQWCQILCQQIWSHCWWLCDGCQVQWRVIPPPFWRKVKISLHQLKEISVQQARMHIYNEWQQLWYRTRIAIYLSCICINRRTTSKEETVMNSKGVYGLFSQQLPCTGEEWIGCVFGQVNLLPLFTPIVFKMDNNF